MNTVGPVTIFGGTGFIGTHMAQHLLQENLADRIVLVDLAPPRDEPYTATLQQGLRSGRVEYIQWDVRKPIPVSLLQTRPSTIFNLAAIHREPGHKPCEYFQTNIYGAENVCEYATASQCSRIVFTSSISPYGATEEQKDETSLTTPETPYGSSKLVAEKIHMTWRAACPDRRLLILRPGVVFGPGENGNVTRLIRSVLKGYFIYIGNRATRKAGGYVKELCYVTQFGLEHQEKSGEKVTLLNFSMNPPPTLEDFVDAIRAVTGSRPLLPSLPRPLIIWAAYLIEAVADAARIKQPISSVRVRKLFHSTRIDPKRLRDLGYKWHFGLEDAFRDWMQARPRDFLK